MYLTDVNIKELALLLDASEAGLVLIQSRLWQVRKKLQKIIGTPVGYQYNDTNDGSFEEGLR